MIGFLRGHSVEWNEDNQKWYYTDNGLEYDDSRPCPHCQIMPTEDGYDPCLGKIEEASGACCGHGVHPAYTTYPGIAAPYGWWNCAWIGIEALDDFYRSK